MKKILVTAKRVPDYEMKVKIADGGRDVIREDIKWILNPFDEIAIEEALKISENSSEDVEVVVVSIGLEDCREQIRMALAMGANRGILVNHSGDLDSAVVARALRAIYNKENPDLVIMGKQATDLDSNQTGQLLAAVCNVPQATFASEVVLADDWSNAKVTREVDGGLQTIKIELPAIITADLRLNEPRYPSLPNIVAAKKKQIDVMTCSDLGINAEPSVRITGFSLPESRKKGEILNSVSQLVERLGHSKAN